jgi:hypothetical protein
MIRRPVCTGSTAAADRCHYWVWDEAEIAMLTIRVAVPYPRHLTGVTQRVDYCDSCLTIPPPA